MSKGFSLFFLFGIYFSAGAQNAFVNSTVAKNPRHIVRIAGDSLVVTNGTTYEFTVDTPEDQGLRSTKPSVGELLSEFIAMNGSRSGYKITDKDGLLKNGGELESSDRLVMLSKDGTVKKQYFIALKPFAVNGCLELEQAQMTANVPSHLVLFFTAGQRTPDATVKIYLPKEINITMDNTTVSVIGRGDVKLKDLSTQSIGRTGNKYSYSRVGTVDIIKSATGSLIVFKHLDLRPANGPDLKIEIANVKFLKPGDYQVRASYTTSQPEVLSSAESIATVKLVSTITDFERVVDKRLQYFETPQTYTQVRFKWNAVGKSSGIQLMQSIDNGRSWKASQVKPEENSAIVSGLQPNKLYQFKLFIKDGANKGFSSTVQFYSGKKDIRDFGVTGEDNEDNTDKINEAISYLNSIGGGTLLFSKGIYSVRTVHLKSNVYLYIEKGATIKAIRGADRPESTWFSDKKYRSGLSPTDFGPYENPDNWLTKQDVGHHYFHNCMFFGERIDNVKIIGNGYITGNGNLITSDRVMNNAPDNRADKMFVLKLCTNLEIGGIHHDEDLWYDPEKDEPYYIEKDGSKNFDVDNMLHIDRGGHFALLATGTDNINVHDTYFGKLNGSNARDVYDFMACNNVRAVNIYSKISSDDIIKPGSDCSLGFTRPASHYIVRNIIGDTNCNLFQIGSETADDISDIHVDNIYVLGANKAGFSISANDGAHIRDVHLNCGHTGTLHSRSKMLRTFTPFFISISNRGRILGAEVGKYAFTDNGEKHNELLVKNVDIGTVENIILNGVDISEVYAGSSFNGTRWKPYNDSLREATPIVAGYSLPSSADVEGGLDFKLPNGKHTGYITNIVFNDVHIVVKGGHPILDTAATPPELGVGQYNASNLKTEPSYGIWARHVKELKVQNCSFSFEKPDKRYVIYLDDVWGAKISSVKMATTDENKQAIRWKNSSELMSDDR